MKVNSISALEKYTTIFKLGEKASLNFVFNYISYIFIN